MTGAPGSKWSSVAANIYYAEEINKSDYSDDRVYEKTRHIGAYFDPGFEYDLDDLDGPFKEDGGVKLIKSHTLATKLDDYKDETIILVYRNNIECMDWWLSAGGFNITYPDYRPYYKNKSNMRDQIKKQNNGIVKFIAENFENVKQVHSNIELADLLGLNITEYIRNRETHIYKNHDVQVFVYKR